MKKAWQQARERARQPAAIGWDASPITTARLCAEIWAPDQGPRLVAGRPRHRHQRLAEPLVQDGQALSLARRLRRRRASATVCRPRSAPRTPTRRSAASRCRIQGDGDMMYAPGALWTAARHEIPLLERDAQQPRLPPGSHARAAHVQPAQPRRQSRNARTSARSAPASRIRTSITPSSRSRWAGGRRGRSPIRRNSGRR